eukprot:11741355-Prorocentrum_lima.AAC.1
MRPVFRVVVHPRGHDPRKCSRRSHWYALPGLREPAAQHESQLVPGDALETEQLVLKWAWQWDQE